MSHLYVNCVEPLVVERDQGRHSIFSKDITPGIVGSVNMLNAKIFRSAGRRSSGQMNQDRELLLQLVGVQTLREDGCELRC